MHSRLMEYVDEVARHGSIRAAGARLHVAPSAINRQILLYERDLGEQIFDRLPRGVRLTPAGEVLVAHIRQTMQQYREAIAEIRDLQQQPSGEVVIATMSGLASGIVARAAVRFGARYPGVRLAIRAMSTIQILRAVADGEADLGLGFNTPSSTQLEVCWENDTRLGAVVAPGHPLARLGQAPLELCAQYPLILPDEAMLIHGLIADAFSAAGLEAGPRFTTDTIETMKRIAAASEAIAFLSRFDVAEEQRSGTLAYVAVPERAFGGNVLSLVRHEKFGQSLASHLFAEELTIQLQAVLNEE